MKMHVDMEKNNNFILGKKRLSDDKYYEETNEEFNIFDLIIVEFKKDKNNDKKIQALLDKDRIIIIKNIMGKCIYILYLKYYN